MGFSNYQIVSFYLKLHYSIAITKLDILDDFDEVKIGVSYCLNGQPISAIPGKWAWLDTLLW